MLPTAHNNGPHVSVLLTQIPHVLLKAPGLARLILAATPLLLVLGCGGGGRIVSSSPAEAFEKGAQFYNNGRYSRAVEQLQAVFDFGRAHEYAADAQFMLSESYFKSRQYLLASSEYDRFIQLYSGDARVEEAEFKRAMSYYHQSPRYHLDQQDTRQAINYLRLYVSRYPQGAWVEEAGERIDELQGKLAQKLFNNAALYERAQQYEAAAISYERVLETYPTAELAPLALVGAIRSYIAYAERSVASRQVERLDKALDTYARLIQIFPDSDVLKDAEDLYGRATELKEQALSGTDS